MKTFLRILRFVTLVGFWLLLAVPYQLTAQTNVHLRQVGQWPGYARGDANGVAVTGHYAYIAAGGGGLIVVDVSNPSKCVRVGGCDTPGYATGVTVLGNYAYVAAGTAGLLVIDVSNPTNCVRVGGYATGGYVSRVVATGEYAFVADDNAGLQVINVSNPTNCVLVGGYSTTGYARSVALLGRYAYVAGDRLGLQVIDVSDPTNCVLVGFYDTPGTPLAVTVVENYLYVAVGNHGLVVLQSEIQTTGLPIIVQAPLNQSAVIGSDVSFSVTAISDSPLTYQWEFNGQPLTNQTALNLTLHAVSPQHAGSYAVTVSNASGSMTTSPAVLTVTGDLAQAPQFQRWSYWLGEFLMQVQVPKGVPFVIEGSYDLRVWEQIISAQTATGAYEFKDEAAWQHPRRFYRVVIYP